MRKKKAKVKTNKFDENLINSIYIRRLFSLPLLKLGVKFLSSITPPSTLIK